MGTLQRLQVVADRAEGADQEFHDGRVHRRQIAKIQAARFRQQRMQSIYGGQARARERIERPAPDRKANAVIEAGNLTPNPFPRGKGPRGYSFF
jgi:hypothetical protein